MSVLENTDKEPEEKNLTVTESSISFLAAYFILDCDEW